jgi:HSP20 family molecular chaperone IbpA
MLHLHAEHNSNGRSRDNNSTLKQFGYHDQTIPLPLNIAAQEIEAHFENGELTIIIPKLNEKNLQPRNIKLTKAARQASQNTRRAA